MKRKPWQDQDGHPPSNFLLLHLERELDRQDAEAVRLHVAQCARCRRVCEQLEHGMSHFIAFRDKAILPTPTVRASAFRERLLAAQAETASISIATRLRDFFGLHSPRRWSFVLGGATFSLIACLFFFLSTPRQSVYASQLLDNARNASDSLIAHSKILNQKIRLQRGSYVIERSVRHGRRLPVEARDPSLDVQLRQALDLAHINWGDPLNANDFAAWRASQPERTDSVNETPQSVTITTRVRGSGITEGTLTLARPGWRPIARTVAFRDEPPIEITEVSYTVADYFPEMRESATLSPLPGTSSAPSISGVSSEVSRVELETSELDLREALHSIGADVSASPEIWRSQQTVLFHVFPQNPGQEEAIRETASRIPHVKQTDSLPAGSLKERAATQGTGAYATTPPLANALAIQFGSAQAAGDFFASLQKRSSHVIAEANALDQLGNRYSAETIKTLPPALVARVNRLAASLLSSVQHNSADYLKALSPTLDTMAQQQKVAPPSEDGQDIPPCLPWQENAALAAPKLRDLELKLSLLFVPSHTESRVTITTDSLISDSLKDRFFLKSHLLSTCQLFGPN